MSTTRSEQKINILIEKVSKILTDMDKVKIDIDNQYELDMISANHKNFRLFLNALQNGRITEITLTRPTPNVMLRFKAYIKALGTVEKLHLDFSEQTHTLKIKSDIQAIIHEIISLESCSAIYFKFANAYDIVNDIMAGVKPGKNLINLSQVNNDCMLTISAKPHSQLKSTPKVFTFKPTRPSQALIQKVLTASQSSAPADKKTVSITPQPNSNAIKKTINLPVTKSQPINTAKVNPVPRPLFPIKKLTQAPTKNHTKSADSKISGNSTLTLSPMTTKSSINVFTNSTLKKISRPGTPYYPEEGDYRLENKYLGLKKS